MVLETYMKLRVVEPDILEKLYCPKNQRNVPKIEFFEFIERFGH